MNSASRVETYELHTRADSYAGFIQDDWRITPKLTLNIGLRYDLDQPRWETHNRQNSFDPAAINPVSGTPGVIAFSGVNGAGKYANRWDRNNFGPRIGLAWKLSDSLVVRGGGAILYTGEYDQATPIVANTGFSTQGNFVSPDNGITPAFLLAGGLPPVLSPTSADLTPGFGAVPIGKSPTTSVAYFNPNRSVGYLYQANFDIQKQLPGNVLIDVGYLGTFGHHLPAPDAQSINQVPTAKLGAGNAQSLRPFPQFSNVSIIAADSAHRITTASISAPKSGTPTDCCSKPITPARNSSTTSPRATNSPVFPERERSRITTTRHRTAVSPATMCVIASYGVRSTSCRSAPAAVSTPVRNS